MTIPNKANRVDTKYLLVTGLAVALSWTIHEFAHWSAGTFLGYDMAMTLNKVFPVNGQYSSSSHYQIISAAGPLLTLAEAIVIFVIMRRMEIKLLYPFLFTCLYMRFFATIISFRNPNDEARISKSLGLGTFTLPIIMTAILLLLVYKVSLQYGFDIKFNIINLGLIIFFSSFIILADQFFHVRLF